MKRGREVEDIIKGSLTSLQPKKRRKLEDPEDFMFFSSEEIDNKEKVKPKKIEMFGEKKDYIQTSLISIFKKKEKKNEEIPQIKEEKKTFNDLNQLLSEITDFDSVLQNDPKNQKEENVEKMKNSDKKNDVSKSTLDEKVLKEENKNKDPVISKETPQIKKEQGEKLIQTEVIEDLPDDFFTSISTKLNEFNGAANNILESEKSIYYSIKQILNKKN